jgi:hypothetical protein
MTEIERRNPAEDSGIFLVVNGDSARQSQRIAFPVRLQSGMESCIPACLPKGFRNRYNTGGHGEDAALGIKKFSQEWLRPSMLSSGLAAKSQGREPAE